MPRTMFYGHRDVKVAIQPNIGLDAMARQSVVEMLNLLRADEAILALKTGSVEGNAGKMDISDLQSLFDAQHHQIIAISDELAERIQILGGLPLSGSEKLNDSARLKGDGNAVGGIMSLLANYEAFIRFLREDVQKCSEMYEDQGTFALLVNIMRIHEKMVWILRSNIAVEQFVNEK